MNERISFPLNRKSVATERHKKFVQNIRFHDMEKQLPMEGIFAKLKQNNFHWPEI